jgi:hypothetical protein
MERCVNVSQTILHAVGMFVVGLFKSWCRLEAENLLLAIS